MGKQKSDQRQPRVTIEGEVLRQIRQHARSNSKTEVCGVLIGQENGAGVAITARIPGLNAAQAGTYVTFTQDTWEHIYRIKDKDFPEARIVGWYHSHPGFGVFLSDHDTFIHKNFFSSALQVAWVYDPHSDEEGCFGWSGERLERVAEIHVKDDKGGEGAGETGKPEPVSGIEEQDQSLREHEISEINPPAWLKWGLTIASHLLLAAIAFAVAWLFFPQQRIFFVDPFNHTAIEAPPGTRISPDGNLSVPKPKSFEGPTPDKNAKPTTPQSEPQAAPKSDGGKDQNVPRQ
ncbi:MAG TPA: Mov34/MPN/PAD-1 family protein [Candidatus Acidoferrum sp.]|jgi:proteasome lid subunit RPN8/RPN11